MTFTSIDLFAGCGGLSLGLEQSGFETVFVNELHPAAMDTFLVNRPSERLHLAQNRCYDLRDLTANLSQLESLTRRLQTEFPQGIDIVSGGPPCQGFSGIGHRRSFEVTKAEMPSNHLYKDMARFIQAVKPRVFVFENVRGLLTARWGPGGTKGEIWEDVLATFAQLEVAVGRRSVGYAVASGLLLAKDYGVPQNRPRVVIVGMRKDIFDQLPTGTPLLPATCGRAPDLIDLLGDLIDPEWVDGGTTTIYPHGVQNAIQRELRTGRDGRVRDGHAPLTEHQYSRHSPRVKEKFQHMIDSDGQIPDRFKTKKFAQRLLPRTWDERGPSITATSLPDDYVHFEQPRTPTVREWARLQTFPDWYEFTGGRTTGGRRRAGDPGAGNWHRDLPKYTQIGNAVPVQLARAIGQHLALLLGGR